MRFEYARNAASQIGVRTNSNDSFAFTTPFASAEVSKINGLNQINSRGPSSGSQTGFTHDDNGNLTSDGSKTYAYDIENRLVSVTPSGGSVE